MTNSAPINKVISCTWQEQQHSLHDIRRQVFIEEQNVPEALEWDDEDTTATHFLAFSDNGSPIGVARLLPSGQIGRMCVLKPFRRSGIASLLLGAAEAAALNKGMSNVFLHAQCYISHFYAKHGYVCQGEEFMDAGIPHIEMLKALK
ncbi:MAG: GNAT family N-acetyltransferase [Pseudomonadales bacterium]|nr:GNAT family N-acetyltransferase [Pseudomonadales bacterium]